MTQRKKSYGIAALSVILALFFLGCRNPALFNEVDGLNVRKIADSANFLDAASSFDDLSMGSIESVDLLAGRDLAWAGTVYVEWTAENELVVTYDTSLSGWYITETHLQVGFYVTEENFAETFHLNRNFSPKIGNFEQSAYWDSATKVSISIPIPPDSTDVYIAAHGVVYESTTPSFTSLSDYLATLNPATVTLPYTGGINGSKYTAVINGSDGSTTQYPAWCIDPNHGISWNTVYDVELISSYAAADQLLWLSSDPYYLYVENLGALNWLLNNMAYWAAATTSDMQAAIHILMSGTTAEWDYDSVLVAEIVATALTHADFIPTGGDKVAVLTRFPGTTPWQILIIIMTMPGTPDSETAWAQGPEFALGGGDWSMYFGFNLIR